MLEGTPSQIPKKVILQLKEEKTPPLGVGETTSLIERLKNPQTGIFKLTPDTQMGFLVGFDPEKKHTKIGWSCFLLPGQDPNQDIRLYDHKDNLIDLKREEHPLHISNVKKMIISGQSYSIERDAWARPTIYPLEKEEEKLPNPNFLNALNDSIKIWEASLLGEEEVDRAISEVLGEETSQYIKSILAIMENYPEMQNRSLWFKALNIWDLAYTSGSYEKVKKVLREGSKGTEKIAPDLQNSKVEEKILKILEKITNGHSLDQEESLFIDAMSTVDFAIKEGLNMDGCQLINDITRKYSMANLAENLICQQRVGWKVYEEHQKDYWSFFKKINDSGTEIPEWISPYNGSEFQWTFALNSRIANPDTYFIGSKTSPQQIRRVFNHERIHCLASIAHTLGFGNLQKKEKETGKKMPTEKWGESFTETMALLIQNQGDINKAIVRNLGSDMRYKTGVQELLLILQEIEKTKESGFGSKIMIEGLLGRSRGEFLAQTTPVREYYDQVIAKENGAFQKRMAPYMDAKCFRDSNLDVEKREPPSLEVVSEVATNAVKKITWDQLNPEQKRQMINENYFNGQKEFILQRLSEFPLEIITPHYFESFMVSKARGATFSNPEATKQLEGYVRIKYLDYLDSLTRLKKTGKKPIE